MSFKVAFIGAGSVGFTRKIIRDVLCIPEFNNITISLMDINEQNLDMIKQLVERDVKANGLADIKIQTTTNQKQAVQDARYIINVVRIGGLEAFETDIEIPLKYGIDQCVGDTLGPGGIMYGQRGIVMMLDLCTDIKVCAEKNALLLNFANPNAMMTWAANHYGKVNCLGLCHGVQAGHQLLANVLNIPQDELNIICAGINHQTWYIKLMHNGRDLCKDLLTALENHKQYSQTEKVRIDMLKRFGYFSTESNGHLSEYVPWYRKRQKEIKDWISMDSWINGETGGYLRVCTEKRNWFVEDFPKWLAKEPFEYSRKKRSIEHASFIIEGLETGRIYRGHFNVVNKGTITNLPADAIVEVPGYIDTLGINIPIIGNLPLGPAAVCNTSISVQRMAVLAAVNGDDQLLRQAVMLDPLSGAVCNPPEIWQMVDEMLVAQEKWLPQYKDAIQKARQRLTKGPLIPVKQNKGAARKDLKSVSELREHDTLNVESQAFKFKN